MNDKKQDAPYEFQDDEAMEIALRELDCATKTLIRSMSEDELRKVLPFVFES